MEKIPVKAFAFVLILFFLLSGANAALTKAAGSPWIEMEVVRAHPNSYDVCFLGPSTAMENNANQELYNRYGIAGISFGGPLRPTYISRYTLEEFLMYQAPQVVFLDTSSLFYDNYAQTV